MNRKKIITIAIALGVLMVTGVIGAGVVVAANSAKNPSIIQKLSERFNLNSADVQKVFTAARDERYQEMQQEMQTRLKEQLDEAVKEGKITEEQKGTILKKETQIQEKQKELMELQQELRDWAEENNIDLSLFFGHGPRRGMGGMGRPFGGYPGL
jgi:uncharacterized membrane protein YhiD involved in acid resistance